MISPFGFEDGTQLSGSTETLQLRFHHVGVACTDLEKETRQFASLGYSREGEDFEDPRQGIRGRFLSGQLPRIELLAPLEDSKVLEAWLSAKVKMYHLAYETPALKESIERLCAQRARVMRPPVPAVAFQMREIAFLMLPNLLLVELIALR